MSSQIFALIELAGMVGYGRLSEGSVRKFKDFRGWVEVGLPQIRVEALFSVPHS
jgi:hypothetical protein